MYKLFIAFFPEQMAVDANLAKDCKSNTCCDILQEFLAFAYPYDQGPAGNFTMRGDKIVVVSGLESTHA